MTPESIINQIGISSPSGLSKVYDGICEEYRKRLCEQWEVRLDESWWVADEIGGELCIADAPWGIGMSEIRYLVDHAISQSDFLLWWDFVEDEIHDGQPCPRINFKSWFERGLRPEMLKEKQNREK